MGAAFFDLELLIYCDGLELGVVFATFDMRCMGTLFCGYRGVPSIVF